MYIIAGATATGKTAVALELAKKIGGEIISADSMQVYRGMNIGTAKPTIEEMAGIPHHLIDVVNPDEAFSVAQFQKMAQCAIEEIYRRGNVPILAGGTGFYINAVLYGANFPENNEHEEELRVQFTALAQEKGADFLHKKLTELDSAYAQTVHANNVKRVARALAYCEASGKLFSEYNRIQKEKKPLFNAEFYVLSTEREILYERINARTNTMFKAGLIDEVQNLLEKGYHKGLAAMQGIGYKETVQIICGEVSRKDAIDAIQQATRNYAKRQETWFKNQTSNASIINTEENSTKEIAEKIMK